MFLFEIVLFHLACLQGSCCSICQNFHPFKGRIIFHFMDIWYFVYPLICRWTLEFLPLFGYCGHRYVDKYLFNTLLSFLLIIYPEVELPKQVEILFNIEELIFSFSQWLHSSHYNTQGFNFSKSLPTLVFWGFGFFF